MGDTFTWFGKENFLQKTKNIEFYSLVFLSYLNSYYS